MNYKYMEIKLKTSYEETGNSNDMQISTLAIAVDGRDFNDIWEDCDMFRGQWGIEDYVINEFDFEPHFIKSLDKSAKKFYREELKEGRTSEYDSDLDTYINRQKELIREDACKIKELNEELEQARDNYYDEQFKEWLYGDYGGDWNGILTIASKDYNVEFEYDREKDILSISNYEDRVEELIEEEEIKKEEEFIDYLQEEIYLDAKRENNKRIEERDKTAGELKKIREYQAKQKIEEEKRRKEELLNKLK